MSIQRKVADLKTDRPLLIGGDEMDFVKPRSRRALAHKAGTAKRIRQQYNQRRRRLAKNAIAEIPAEHLTPVVSELAEQRAFEERIAWKIHTGEPLTFMEWMHTVAQKDEDARLAAELEAWELRHVHGLS